MARVMEELSFSSTRFKSSHWRLRDPPDLANLRIRLYATRGASRGDNGEPCTLSRVASSASEDPRALLQRSFSNSPCR